MQGPRPASLLAAVLRIGLLMSCACVGLLAQAPNELPTPLRLDDVIRVARAHRAEIGAARARVRAAAQRPAIVSALEDPMISPAIDHLPFMLDGVDVSVTVEQRFPLSGVRAYRRRGAQADLTRTEALAEQTTLDVTIDAAGAFLMLAERRRTAAIVDEQLALAREVVGAANARYAAATGQQVDVLRAEIEVARLEGRAQTLVPEIRGAEAMLNAAMGRPTALPIPPVEMLARDGPAPPPSLVTVAAVDRRPELRAAGAEISRAEADIDVMRAMYRPMALVRAGPARTMAEGGGVMVMVGLSLPIWRTRLRAGVAEAEAMADMARADRDAMQRMVEGQAASAREQVEAARVQYLSLRDTIVPRARMAIEPGLGAYAAGRLPLVSVIDLTQALWSLQAELVEAEVSLAIAWTRLDRAIGGGGLTP
jgi:outer membrane protein TolC